MANFTVNNGSGTGNGSFTISGTYYKGRKDRGSIGTVSVVAGNQTKTVTVYQNGHAQFVSSAEQTFVGNTFLNVGAAASTLNVTFYSNAAAIKIEKLPYDSSASTKIYSWNSKGHNYDDENTSQKYSDASISGVFINNATSATPVDANDGAYHAGTVGESGQYPVKVAISIPVNSDNAQITRKFKISVLGGQGVSLYTLNSYEMTITQNAGAVTLSVSPTTITLAAAGTAQTVNVTTNTTWTATAN